MKNFFLLLFTVVTLGLPPFFWLTSVPKPDRRTDEPVQVLSNYLKFLYARDFRHAYRFIAAADQRLKPVNDYARERESFSGFTLEAARKLSGAIEIRPASEQPEGNGNRVTVNLKLPDANALSNLLLDWDEKRLNVLSAPAQKKILASIDNLIQQKKLPMIEGKEEFILVKEDSQWRVFLNWAAGVKIKFTTILPSGKTISAEPLTKETVARSGDVFTVGFKVKNRSSREIVTRIVHRIEPKDVAQYLDLVECALLLPVRLRPGEEQTYNSTYTVRGDLPDGIKGLDVTYEFKVES
jgi:cytochrome c oxidase assembly protein CtaG/Cox11